jgi:citronellol/citronellal dehydrogenase
MADAAHIILTRPAREFSGNFCVDDEVLRSAGVTDLSSYLHVGAKESDLLPDFFV